MKLHMSRLISVFMILAVWTVAPQTVARSQTQQPRRLFFAPLRWSEDGRKLAIPLDNIVEVRDAATHQLLFTLRGHTDVIASVAWKADDSMLATASSDKTVRLWRASDGRLIRTLSDHNNYVGFVAWTPDGQFLVSSGFDVSPNFFVRNGETGDVVARHLAGTVGEGKYSPDGRKFALVGGGDLRIRDSMIYDLIAVHRGSSSFNIMHSVAWSSDGGHLVTGSGDGLVTVWNADRAAVEMQFRLTDYTNNLGKPGFDPALASVRDVRFGEDDTTVLGIAGDGTLKEWDIQTGAVLQETRLPALATASWSPFGARLAVLDASFLPALDGTPSPKRSAATGFQVIVPAPSLARLNMLAAVCVGHGDTSQAAVRALTAQAITQATLPAFDSQVNALPAGVIPAACQADLLAMSAALQDQ